MRKILIILVTFLFTNMQSQVVYSDCPGYCLTSSGLFNASTGNISELNSSNRGCLVSNESSSSFWFQICFTSNGVFQFYINPSGNKNDFDWAIWNSIDCPPSSSPIRCSYANVPNSPCVTCDWTGLGINPNTNIMASDVSEDSNGDGYLAPINVSNGECLIININNFGNGSNTFSMNISTDANIGYSPMCNPLPIELISFDVISDGIFNILNWKTATEFNNNYFTIEKSFDGLEWKELCKVNGNGSSTSINNYSHRDLITNKTIIYYRLSQTDYDGTDKYYQIIYIDNSIDEKKIQKVFNILGIEVDKNSKGILILQYSDGSVKKVVMY